mgnify:CR=1 FL=1
MKSTPILILPGTLCTGAMFKQQIAHLSQCCDEIDVVQFSTENTLADMAQKVIQVANDRACAIIGFSMGGIVAMEVARTRPDIIAKLALINSNSHADLPERKVARAAQIARVRNGGLAQLVSETLLPNYLYTANPAHETLITEMALSLGAACFEAQVTAIEDRPDSLSVLQALDTNLLIIGGEDDKVCPASHQQAMYQATPTSQLVLLEQCGHFSPLEQADDVSRLLSQWYNS